METTFAMSPACGGVPVPLDFGDQLSQVFIVRDVALDILVNKAAHIFISVNIQLGCVFDPEDGVSVRGTPCLKLDSDGIIDQLTKGMHQGDEHCSLGRPERRY